MTPSDFKEITDYIKENSSSIIDIDIIQGMHKMEFKFNNKLEQQCTITVFMATKDDEANAFPKLTKTTRLKDG